MPVVTHAEVLHSLFYQGINDCQQNDILLLDSFAIQDTILAFS